MKTSLIKNLLEQVGNPADIDPDKIPKDDTPDMLMALETIKDFYPEELSDDLYKHYDEIGFIVDGKTWNIEKLEDLYKTNPKALLKLYDVVSEKRYEKTPLITKFVR